MTGRKKKTPNLHLSNVVRPHGMSDVQWQQALRRQIVSKECFGISETDAKTAPGEYVVWNPRKQSRHVVTYHGEGHPLNSCTCMDFRTSRIGTCKHLEAIKVWITGARGRSVRRSDARLTTLYMDYSGIPTPKIHYGSEDKEALRLVLSQLFQKDGELCPQAGEKLSGAIRDAAQVSLFFRCREDVADYAAAVRDERVRHQILDKFFRRENWWQDIFSEGIVPYPYQREGIEFAARTGRAIIADEMGLGKTIQAIGAGYLLYREGLVSSILVVCPTSLKYQWKREIQKFIGLEALVIEGSLLQRKACYNAKSLFKIVSYNALNNDVKFSGSIQTDMVIMDEVQRLKNWDTQIAKAARRVRSDYTLILSGTPLENKLEELYSITQLVDQYLLGPYYAFRTGHIVTSPSGKVVGYKGLNDVGKTMERVLLRRRKADVALQLPERMDKNLFVPMTREQMEVHEENKDLAARIIHKWQTTHFLSETDRRRLMMFLANMRMSCDSTYILDQKTRFDTKIDETLALIDSIFSSGDEKVVVFSGWERMTRLIAMELDARDIAYSNLHGSVPSAKRKDLIDRFTDDPDVRVFLSTDAGATGLNLQAASYVINLDLPWNPAVLEQRIGRIYRLGQKRNIQVINLVSAGTIEEGMLTKLKFKTDLFDGVLNGGENDVFLPDNKLAEMVKNLGFEQVADDSVLSADGPDAVSATAPVADTVDADEIERKVENPVPDDKAVESSEDEAEAEASAEGPEALINEGVSFIGNLMRTLQEPESAGKLVDALVQEDASTGETSIRIPVKSKDSVRQFVSLLGKLMKGLG